MKHHIATLLILTIFPAALPLEAGYVIEPTLLSPKESTLVTARATDGASFYPGHLDPPSVRVGLMQNRKRITTLLPKSISPTRITFMFPGLAVGYYGLVVEAESSGVWKVVAQSAEDYFKVGADTSPRLVFQLAEPAFPEVQRLYPTVFLETNSVDVSGEISGQVTTKRLVSDWNDKLDWKWLRNFDYDGEGDCGIENKLDFNLDDEATFDYKIPFSMKLVIPQEVHAGQQLLLAPKTLTYSGGDSLRVHHDARSSTVHQLMINAPYDTLPPVNIKLDQQPNSLRVSGSVPTGIPWVDVDFKLPPIGWPSDFDDGEVSYGGVTLKIGGRPDYTTNYAKTLLIPEAGSRQIWTGETRVSGVWSASGDLMVFLSMAGIPYVSYAAYILSLANVELNQNWNVNVKSTDFIHLMPVDLYDLGISIPGSASGSHTVTQAFEIPVRGYLVPQYLYEMANSTTFDMPKISEKTIADWPLGDIASYQHAEEHTFYAKFTVTTTVNVLSRDGYIDKYASGAPANVKLTAMNYLPSEATAERLRIGGLVHTNPPAPPVIPTTGSGTFPPEAESEFSLMLTVSPPEGGTVAASPAPVDGGYAAGTVVTLLAKPAAGYLFAGWRQDATGTANPIKITMNDVRAVTPLFSKIPPLNSEITVKQPAGKDLKDGVSSRSFGSVAVKSSETKTFTIKNTGKAQLTYLAIAKTGKHAKDFTIRHPHKKTLAPGASTIFKVIFKPSAKGNRRAAIHIRSNDSNENPFDIALTGKGVAAKVKSVLAKSTLSAPGVSGNADKKITSSTSTVRIHGRKYACITLHRNGDGNPGQESVEVSSNLVDWFRGPKHTTVLKDIAEVLKVRDNASIERGKKRFIRVKGRP